MVINFEVLAENNVSIKWGYSKEMFMNYPTPLYFIPEINFGIDENKSRQVCLKNIVDDLSLYGFQFMLY